MMAHNSMPQTLDHKKAGDRIKTESDYHLLFTYVDLHLLSKGAEEVGDCLLRSAPKSSGLRCTSVGHGVASYFLATDASGGVSRRGRGSRIAVGSTTA